MERTIWKFPLEMADEQYVFMPEGASLLHVGAQDTIVSIWALVDPEARKQQRTIRVAGTGHPLPDNPGTYVGTFMLHGGVLVFHVFDATAREEDAS